jgi:hypothetical protein
MSLFDLQSLYSRKGITNIYYKVLASNDNSKNQPYFAGHITDIPFIPTGKVVASESTSEKTDDPRRRVKFSFQLSLSWLSSEGETFSAPNTQLIYYPQYPEVRLSGFLSGCQIDSCGWMDPHRHGREEGRILFLGVKPNSIGPVLAFLALPGSRICEDIRNSKHEKVSGVFYQLPISLVADGDIDSKTVLLRKLRDISNRGWIPSSKLDGTGSVQKYLGKNGGGYTLEAALGIAPNGIPEPDILGWEVKQFGVRDFTANSFGHALTLMTPEPDCGLYIEDIRHFVEKYGRHGTVEGRVDYSGIHKYNKTCKATGLRLVVPGYDSVNHEITDSFGMICLVDTRDSVAAGWSFAKVLEHWKKKHNKAVYVKSLKKTDSDEVMYRFGGRVRMFERTTVYRFLDAVCDGVIYYDPAVKIDNGKLKKRNQFRAKYANLQSLYESCEDVDATQVK